MQELRQSSSRQIFSVSEMIIRRYSNVVDAELALSALQGAGVEAQLVDDSVNGAFPSASFAGGGVGIEIPREQEAVALDVLKQVEHIEPENSRAASALMRRAAVAILISWFVLVVIGLIALPRFRTDPVTFSLLLLAPAVCFGAIYAVAKKS